MQKVLLVARVARQELYTTFRRKTYLLFAFGIPILVVLIVTGIRLIKGERAGNIGMTGSPQAEYHIEREGFVDHSGLIRVIPQNISADQLIAYQDEEGAKQALKAGEIVAYYVIPADYIEKGKFFYVYPDTRSYLSDGQEWIMSWTLTVNLLGGEEILADKVWSPMWDLQEISIASGSQASATLDEDCSRPGIACQTNDLIRYLPFITMALLYAALMASSSMLFNSICSEKENRTIELLMLSIDSRQLLAGKTIALGSAGLAQTVVWLCAIFIALKIGGSTLSLPENFTFPTGIIAWSLVFFLGGYGVYASLMAGAGALVPKMKEAGIANFVAMIPLFLGYFVGLVAPLARATNEALPVALSLFPLTAPVVMVVRMTDSSVPLWQLLLSAGLTFLTAYLVLRAASAMFQAQNLLSGQPFSIQRYFRAMLGKA